MGKRTKPATPADAEQPALPGCEVAAVSLEVVKDPHTGSTVLKNMQRATEIVESWLAVGINQTAIAMRCDKRSVAACVQWFADNGKLPPLKDKLAGRIQIMLLDLVQGLHRDVVDEVIDAHDKSILMGIGLDKLPALLGDLAPAQEHRHLHVHASLEEFNRQFALGPAALKDVSSVGGTAEKRGNGGNHGS